ncbi:MAG: hypothetical protein R2844_17470 [Caldilineales bacterium]
MNSAHENPTVNPHPATFAEYADLPYPPSYVNRLIDFIQRLPVHYGLTFLLLFLLQVAVFQIVSWVDGWLPAYTFAPVNLLFPLWMWGSLAIVVYLDNVAHEVLADFSSLLDITSDKARRLDYEFTTMPSRAVIVTGIIWSALYALTWYLAYDSIAAAYGFGPFMFVLTILAGFVSYFIGSVFYYHTIRQLRLVTRTVRMVDRFDLFRLDPVYSFSVLTSQTGLFWVLMLTCTLLILQVQVAFIPVIATLSLQIALAVAAFILPLRSVHQALVQEKRKQLAELDQRFKSTLASLHRCVDQNVFHEITDLNNVLTALNSEREIVVKIATWPWRPGLFAGFITVALVPIILYLIQLALGKLLGG